MLTRSNIFKLVIPIGGFLFALSASCAYLFVPLSRGDSPRWGPAIFPFIATLLFICWSHDVYKYLMDYRRLEDMNSRPIHIKLFWCCCLSMFSTVSTIFFMTTASEAQMCSHTTCDADIAWNILIFCIIIGYGCTLKKIDSNFLEIYNLNYT